MRSRMLIRTRVQRAQHGLFWGGLRQDQAVLRSVVLIQAGLLGVQLVVEDGQLAQAFHKGVGLWGEHCR